MTLQRLALIPLDDRPPTALFAQRIAKIAGVELLVPPRPLLGNFMKPGDPEKLAAWLEQTVPEVDAALIAVDMLAYGGLIASRSPETSLPAAKARVEVLRHIHEIHPQVQLLCASVIMRISITASNRQSDRYYRAIIRYSELSYQVEQQGRSDLLPELEQVSKLIPNTVLNAYLAARARNHAINRLMVELLAEGVVDHLILTQEDASQQGPHLVEQRLLHTLAVEKGVGERVLIYPGADEGAQTLLAYWLTRTNPVRVRVTYTSQTGALQTAPFEDRPLNETVIHHLAAAGCQTIEANPDAVLWVHTTCSCAERAAAVDAIEELIKAGNRVCLADVCVPNGADSALIDELRKRGTLPHLLGYSAWNTAGNSIGTAVSTLTACVVGNQSAESESAREAFLWERLVDDWGYQRVVRAEIDALLDKQGFDSLNLGENKCQVESLIRQRLQKWAADLWVSGGWSGQPPVLNIHLPWPRTFEVEVSANPDSF